MYGWIWARLPGGYAARTALVMVLLIVAGLVLWYVAYPWASLHLPFGLAGLG